MWRHFRASGVLLQNMRARLVAAGGDDAATITRQSSFSVHHVTRKPVESDFFLPPEALQLLQSARRVQTPCGAGHLTWHIWGSGAPVVMLHGGSGSWNHWLRNIPALVDAGRLVCVPDLPGFGESAVPPGTADADTSVAPLLAGLDAVLPDLKFDLAGFSFGSMVAGLIAAQAPQRVSRLVLIGAPILPLARTRGIQLTPWRHLPTREQQLEAHRRNLGAMMLHSPEAIDATALALHAANVPRDCMPGRRLVKTDALAQALRQVTGPIWAIYGSEDPVYRDDWKRVRAAWQAIPALRELVFVPEAGHWTQYERPGEINALLLRALRS